MKLHEHTGPSYADLRPFKRPVRTRTFPVYGDLVETLLAADEHPDATVAHVLAVCAGYAYSDIATVSMMMARLGLERNECLMIDEYVDVMFITSTSFLIQSSDGRVAILCYRGTPPMSLTTWLTDLNIEPTRIKVPSPTRGGGGYVHGGFYRNVRSTRFLILEALRRAIAGQSVRPAGHRMRHRLEALYIAGHSLGGASAAMMALLLTVEPAYRREITSRLKAVYTYGAPMIASPELARDCNEHELLRERVIRCVYADDIVPQLPPKESGPFMHFGTGLRYKKGEGRDPHETDGPKQLKRLVEIPLSLLSVFSGDLRLTRRIQFHASLRDHLPEYYIVALTPPGVPSEFGD